MKDGRRPANLADANVNGVDTYKKLEKSNKTYNPEFPFVAKHKQGFPDYMLGTYEVDTSNNKIYYNEAELTLENLDTHKEPIDFKLPDIEY